MEFSEVALGQRNDVRLLAMANAHYARIGDVWKHLPLVEVLTFERPGRYWESHAGSLLHGCCTRDGFFLACLLSCQSSLSAW